MVGFFDLWVVYIVCLVWVAIVARSERAGHWVQRWPLVIGAGLAFGILTTMMGVAFKMNQPVVAYGEMPTTDPHPLAIFSGLGIHISTAAVALGVGWLIAATARALSPGDATEEDSGDPESA